ncbi:DUF5683 domain-containing protein [Zhouia sp. PK063]|uniref:DUF5683 domain-containing protein n=1 Tax=Zhouia sp. PK063 TaxID=3373602 RepID=UPI0037B19484
MNNKLIALFFFITCSFTAIAQNTNDVKVKVDSVTTNNDYVYDALAPSKAAFYSAILPGLGQIYNKSYWKVPIVYGALGTGIGIYIWNKNQYNRYRDAFKGRLAGRNDDEFWGTDSDGNPLATPILSKARLQDAQELYQRNKDLSLAITIGLYLLNILDANIDAHLNQFNVDDNLTFQPTLIQESSGLNNNKLGLSLTYSF